MRRNPNGTAAAKKWTRERAHGTGPPADATRMDLMPNTKPAASIFGEESMGLKNWLEKIYIERYQGVLLAPNVTYSFGLRL